MRLRNRFLCQQVRLVEETGEIDVLKAIELPGRRRPRVLATLYLGWLGMAIVVPLLSAGVDTRNLTLLCAVTFLVVQLAFLPLLAQIQLFVDPRLVFISFGVFGACCLEAFHMISQPFNSALLITRGMTAAQALTNLVVDLLFTLPSYLLIFAVIWRLINRYDLSRGEYFFCVSLGQCLGDGGLQYFLAEPWMLLFLPYALTKYQAMNLVPYLLVRDALPKGDASWKKYLIPLFALCVTYSICGVLSKALWDSATFFL